MPIAALLFALDVILVIHAARSGRFVPWGYVILMLPGIGSFAYLGLVCAPEWLSSPKGDLTVRRVRAAIDPDGVYRQARDQLDAVDTIANRTTLAVACLDTHREAEALALYQGVISLPLGEEPHFFLGKARAEFGMLRSDDALSTLDELQRLWPTWRSPAAHLLYARALEQAGRNDEAIDEYRSLAVYFAGVEPRVRLAALLAKTGQSQEAAVLAGQVLAALRRSPKHVQRAEREWGALAKEVARARG